MNFGLLCIIFLISETNSFYVDNDNFHKDVEEKRVLLRKLHNLQEHAGNIQTPTWSEILANVLVKSFSFHKPNNENERVTSVEDEKNIWVKGFSFVLKIYKRYLYDKLKREPNAINKESKANTTEIDENKVNVTHIDKPKVDDEFNTTEMVEDKLEANITDTVSPKDEVELIEPKYHGKLCDNCKESGEIEIDDCDSVKGGKCVTKSSKFIMSVPPHCPVGYRRDWLGYCRVIL